MRLRALIATVALAAAGLLLATSPSIHTVAGNDTAWDVVGPVPGDITETLMDTAWD